ncbi:MULTISPECIES: methylation-associated defense system AAA family ATPase MAD3 [Thermus]|uniref:methylation-associated defense system AAA family ATPase MAD3 n=1 Tax=Thermus TaxID=270 RepID=UPI001F2728C2|nr:MULTISPECIES: AAA family ATPase [Thermus]
MISRIEALNYKCLHYISQDLRPFQILVGPNASGKSTFLDVLVFLQDLLEEGVEAAVLARANTLQEMTWKRQSQTFELAIEMEVPLPLSSSGYRSCRYEIRVGVGTEGGIVLERETFWLKRSSDEEEKGQRLLFPSEPSPPERIVAEPGQHAPAGWRKVIGRIADGRVYFRSETSGWNSPFRIDPRKAALANLPEDEERFPVSLWARRIILSGLHRLMLNSQRMREPCRPDAPRAFQPDGSNLPLVVRQLREGSPERFHRWLAHVKQALPNIEDIAVREREVDRFLFLDVHFPQDLRLPSWMLSDGTLRFLALSLLAYLPEAGKIYLIEEPENGIHPKALELVFQSISSVYDGQVFVATHSPLLLQLAKPDDLLCFALTPNGATDIVRGDMHPKLQKWREEATLGDLLAAGVLG